MYGGRYLVADVKVGLVVPSETTRIIAVSAGFVLFAPMPESRWLLFVSRDPDDAREDLPTAAEFAT
jgi:hypothetical protein